LELFIRAQQGQYPFGYAFQTWDCYRCVIAIMFVVRKLLSWIPPLAIMICARFDSLLIFHVYFASATGHLDSVDLKTFDESLPSINLPVQTVSKEFHIGPRYECIMLYKRSTKVLPFNLFIATH
jgi:hypothetical protein